MTQRLPQLWYVVDENSRQGPFTIEQIQTQLEQKKIRSTDQVVSAPHEPEFRHPDSTLAGNSNSIEMTVMDLIKTVSGDPTTKLFEALQFAKGRSQTPQNYSSTYPGESNQTIQESRNLWIPISIMGGTCAFIVVILKLFLPSLARNPSGSIHNSPTPGLDQTPSPSPSPSPTNTPHSLSPPNLGRPLTPAPPPQGARPAPPIQLPAESPSSGNKSGAESENSNSGTSDPQSLNPDAAVPQTPEEPEPAPPANYDPVPDPNR